MSDRLLIEDRIDYWREQLPGSEDETHTELLCDAEDEIRTLRAALQAATERAERAERALATIETSLDAQSVREGIRSELIAESIAHKARATAAEAERDSLARQLGEVRAALELGIRAAQELAYETGASYWLTSADSMRDALTSGGGK